MGLKREDFQSDAEYKAAKKERKAAKQAQESNTLEQVCKKRAKSSSQVVDSRQDEPNVKKVKIEQAVTSEKVKIDESADNLSVEKFRLSIDTKLKLKERGIEQLFPIQAATFDAIFDGMDVVGRARTGTGKSLAFALPTIEKLKQQGVGVRGRGPAVLVMCPTRELAKQVAIEFQSVSAYNVLTVYGGVPYYDQERGLRNGSEVVVGTPGRLLDHLERGTLKLGNISHVIMDEADQMLDIGFKDSMEKILQAVKQQCESDAKHQILLFSATLPPWIQSVTRTFLRPDATKMIDLVQNEVVKTNTDIQQLALQCGWHQRPALLPDLIKMYSLNGRTIIFTETKQEANELALGSAGTQSDSLNAQVLHGDITQKQREITLQGFKDGKFKVLVATDVAARGLDIPSVELVIQAIPKSTDTFTHRAGRTGRAGRKGTNLLFYKPQEEWAVKNLERKLGIKFNKIGAPQATDMLKTAMTEAVEQLNSVSEKVVPMFLPTAQALLDGSEVIESINVEDKEGLVAQIIARCLAVMTGTIEPPNSRSLLTAAQGETTMIMRLPHDIRSPGFVRSILDRAFPKMGYQDWKSFRMLKDNKGSVFDVDSSKVNDILKRWTSANDNPHTTLEVLDKLPELVERDQGPQNGGGRSYGGGSRGGYSRGGGGGRGNSGYRGGYNRR